MLAPRAMAHLQLTAAAGAVKRVVDAGLRDGVRQDAMPRAARLSRASADDPEGRIAIEHLFDLWTYLGKTLGDPALPIRVAEKTTIEDLNVLGFALMTAPSVREALGTLTRYSALVTDSGTWEVMEVARRVQLRWYRLRPLTLGHRMSNETALAQGVVCLRQLVGRHFDPLEVTFRHAAPPTRAAHGAFFRCPVGFDAPYDSISFHREILDAVPLGANPRLWSYLCKSADELSSQLAPRSIVDAVSHQIVRAMSSDDGGVPSLTHVARALGVTDRTLRRRLRLEGASFRHLVEGARRERAGSLLQGATATVTETALKLGFSDTTAFTHACRRWFGCAPRELRARLRAAPSILDS
jgi:AraC-like DNA-binding protein